jgi:hypothetical protein
MDAWAWSDHLAPWLAVRVELPVGALFGVIDGPTRGRPWSATAARGELRRYAAAAGVRRRFAPHQYADLIVMPTRPGEVLQTANSAVRNIGIIPLHFEGPRAADASQQRPSAETGLTSGCAPATPQTASVAAPSPPGPSIGLTDAALVRISPLGRRREEDVTASGVALCRPRRRDQPKLPGLPRPRRLNDEVGRFVVVPTSAQPPASARPRGRDGPRGRPARRDSAPARTRQPRHHQHLSPRHRQQRDHQHRLRAPVADDLCERRPQDEELESASGSAGGSEPTRRRIPAWRTGRLPQSLRSSPAFALARVSPHGRFTGSLRQPSVPGSDRARAFCGFQPAGVAAGMRSSCSSISSRSNIRLNEACVPSRKRSTWM